MQYYRNKKFAAVKLTSQRTVTRHLTWFLQRETKYPQRKTIQRTHLYSNSFLNSQINKTRKKNCHWRVPTRRFETEDWDGSRGMKIHKGERRKKKRERNKTKGKQPQQRRRVISFSPIYMSAGKWYMSFFFQFSSEGNERNGTFHSYHSGRPLSSCSCNRWMCCHFPFWKFRASGAF